MRFDKKLRPHVKTLGDVPQNTKALAAIERFYSRKDR